MGKKMRCFRGHRILGLALVVLWNTVECRAQDPQPDQNGVYLISKGVTPPNLVHAAPASWPADEAAKHVTSLSVVIGSDGVPSAIDVTSKPIPSFDDAAIAAVRSSKFEPGSVHGRAVPVQYTVFVPFIGKDDPAIPVVNLFRSKLISPPVPLNTVDAEYSEKARREGIEGVVLVRITITEEGTPADIRVLKGLGHGLDECAADAVSKYRFRPATVKGIPIAVPITIAVSFHLRTR
jgi:TonB family protein